MREIRKSCGYPPCDRRQIGQFCWEHDGQDLLRWLTDDVIKGGRGR